jgi:Ca2+-binding RTX toxin-like protein
MIGDRAIITYFDENTGDTLARIVDIREPGQLLEGDRIRDTGGDGLNAGDRIQGRADILVGTVGDDIVIGDLVDPALGGIAGVRFDNTDGKDDDISGGLGNDVLFGGGGSDTIDGGRDLHTPGNVADPTVSDPSPTHYTDTAVFQGTATAPTPLSMRVSTMVATSSTP